MLNKEFSLVFLIGATTCVLFYVHCRNTNTLAKIFYTGICAAGALTAAEFVPHIRDRVQLWFHPELAESTEMRRKRKLFCICSDTSENGLVGKRDRNIEQEQSSYPPVRSRIIDTYE